VRKDPEYSLALFINSSLVLSILGNLIISSPIGETTIGKQRKMVK